MGLWAKWLSTKEVAPIESIIRISLMLPTSPTTMRFRLHWLLSYFLMHLESVWIQISWVYHEELLWLYQILRELLLRKRLLQDWLCLSPSISVWTRNRCRISMRQIKIKDELWKTTTSRFENYLQEPKTGHSNLERLEIIDWLVSRSILVYESPRYTWIYDWIIVRKIMGNRRQS